MCMAEPRCHAVNRSHLYDACIDFSFIKTIQLSWQCDVVQYTIFSNWLGKMQNKHKINLSIPNFHENVFCSDYLTGTLIGSNEAKPISLHQGTMVACCANDLVNKNRVIKRRAGFIATASLWQLSSVTECGK